MRGEELDAVQEAEQRAEALAHQARVSSSSRTGTRSPSAGCASFMWQPQLDAEAVGGRLGKQLTAEQLGALAHPGQAVAISGETEADGHGSAGVRVILDHEHGALREIGQLHLDALRRGVAAHVRQRLLGGAVDGKSRVGRELARRPLDLDGHRQAALLPKRVREHADPLGSRQLIAARGGDRSACILQPAGGDVVSLVQRARDVLVGAPVAREQARALELQRQRREGVREHVVQLAREPAALSGARLRGPRLGQHVALLAQLAHQSQQQEDQDSADRQRQRPAVPRDQGGGEERDQRAGERQSPAQALEPQRGHDRDEDRRRRPDAVRLHHGERRRRRRHGEERSDAPSRGQVRSLWLGAHGGRDERDRRRQDHRAASVQPGIRPARERLHQEYHQVRGTEARKTIASADAASRSRTCWQ